MVKKTQKPKRKGKTRNRLFVVRPEREEIEEYLKHGVHKKKDSKIPANWKSKSLAELKKREKQRKREEAGIYGSTKYYRIDDFTEEILKGNPDKFTRMIKRVDPEFEDEIVYEVLLKAVSLQKYWDVYDPEQKNLQTNIDTIAYVRPDLWHEFMGIHQDRRARPTSFMDRVQKVSGVRTKRRR